jgi:hypothetical protein
LAAAEERVSSRGLALVRSSSVGNAKQLSLVFAHRTQRICENVTRPASHGCDRFEIPLLRLISMAQDVKAPTQDCRAVHLDVAQQVLARRRAARYPRSLTRSMPTTSMP